MKLLIPVMMMVAVLAAPFSGAVAAGGQPVYRLLVQGKAPPAAPQDDARNGRRDRSAGHEGRRGGQGALSEDDRRALRRDIDRANREIYRPRQQR